MIPDITDQDFDTTVEQSRMPILVEFWQPGCRHCQALSQELEHLQQEMGNRLEIYKMNVQENFLIPAELEIQSLPTLALFRGGQLMGFIGGIGKKHQILSQLEDFLG